MYYFSAESYTLPWFPLLFDCLLAFIFLRLMHVANNETKQETGKSQLRWTPLPWFPLLCDCLVAFIFLRLMNVANNETKQEIGKSQLRWTPLAPVEGFIELWISLTNLILHDAIMSRFGHGQSILFKVGEGKGCNVLYLRLADGNTYKIEPISIWWMISFPLMFLIVCHSLNVDW